MKVTALCLLLLAWSGVRCQSSAQPQILNFGGSSLPPPWSGPDSAFCKGAVVAIAGTDFLSANGGESFDSVSVRAGGFFGKITAVSAGDTLWAELPDSFPDDTIVMIMLTKHTRLFGQPFAYSDSIPARLVGDHARIAYPPGPFCLGDANPLPSVQLGAGTSGGFCCWQGGGFSVLPSGEIPLHSGALGTNGFLWAGSHPACPDTLSFSIEIDSMRQASAYIGGASSKVVCENAAALAVDSIGLDPPGGLFSSPSGLALLDDSLGVVDIPNSPPGNHVLVYSAPGCYNPATISIQIEARQSASVLYPNAGTLCPSMGNVAPVFVSGNAGGNWIVNPSGLALGAGGVIDVAASIPGAYSVKYAPPGFCVDTALVAASMQVGVPDTAGFAVDPATACPGDSIFADSIRNGANSIFKLRANGGALLASVNGNGSIRQFITDILPPGGYVLSQLTGGDCPDTLSRSLAAPSPQSAAFSYPPNNLFCLSDADPFPVVSGATGGTFTPLNTATVLGPGGSIDLGASGPGVHPIRYRTPGPCPDSQVVSVTILPSPDAIFSYPASSFCQGDPDPVGTPATAGGTFSAPNGLAIDPQTGQIDLGASQAGSYAVTYTLPGGCASSYTLNITVVSSGSAAALRYPDTLCAGAQPALPILSGDSAGSFSASAGLVFSAFQPGAVDLVQTPPGSYIVWFTPANPCADPVSDSISVAAPLSAAFAYDTAALCIGAANPLPVFVAHPGGSFSASNGLQIDPRSGEIDLGVSLAGLHSVFHTSPGPCPATDGANFQLLPKPEPFIQIDPAGWLCEGSPARIAVSGGVNFGFLLNSQPAASGFDTFETDSLRDGDVVGAIAWNAFGCSDTVFETVAVRPRPGALIVRADTIATGDGLVDLAVMALVDGTEFSLEAVASGDIEATPSSRKRPNLNAGQVWQTSLQIRTWERLDPASLLLLVDSEANGCQGETDSVRVWVTPETDIWIPEIITPNGDGANDTWKMLLPGLGDPMDYEIAVFNRAGGKVAALSPPNQDWDGGDLPDGVYWWLLRDLRDGRELQGGGLTIRRK